MNKLFIYAHIFMGILSTISFASEPVLIMTYVHSRPDFIELHVKTFNAFLKEKYEFYVFNDAPNPAMSQQIEITCRNLGIHCIRVPDHKPSRQTPSYRHMDGIQYSLDLIGYDYNGIVVMVDADMFLTKPLSIEEYMKGYDFIGGYQCKTWQGRSITYSSPCLAFMDMRTLPHKRSMSFEADRVEGVPVDVGGHLYYYFRDNPTVQVKLYVGASKDGLPKDAPSLRTLGFDETTITFIDNIDRKYGMEFHADTYFIHYYAGGSNWPGYSADWVHIKNQYLYNYLNGQIETYKK